MEQIIFLKPPHPTLAIMSSIGIQVGFAAGCVCSNESRGMVVFCTATQKDQALVTISSTDSSCDPAGLTAATGAQTNPVRSAEREGPYNYLHVV